MNKPKSMKGKYWAYFAPNGYLQVRSIAETKAASREELVGALGVTGVTWESYEIMGFYLLKVEVSILPVKSRKE